MRLAGLAVGTRLPPERDLATELGLGRTVLRTVLASLTAEGMLERRQGSGTFVARPLAHAPATGLTEELSHRGLASSTRALGVERVEAPVGLNADGEVTRVRRVRLVGGRPAAVETTWLPDPLPVGLDPAELGGGSLYGTLAAAGAAPVHVSETLEAGLADDETAALLGCPPGSALLLVHRAAYDADGRLVEQTLSSLRGDRFRLASRSDERPVGGLAAMLTYTDPDTEEETP